MTSNITISQVTQFSELEGLGLIQEKGLAGDGLDYYGRLASTVLPRVHFQHGTERNFSEGPEHIAIFRAVEKIDGKEEVVGFATWYFGTGAKKHEQKVDGQLKEGPKEEGAVPVVPPTVPSLDPKETAEVEKAALEEQKAENVEEDAQKVKEKRKIERAQEFMVSMLKPWREWYEKLVVGKQHIYLRQMYILPSYQNRGIASQFMQWGCEKADQNGWPSFLIATESGRRLYLKYGWYDEQVLENEKPNLEIEGKPDYPLPIHRNWIMLRNPKTL